MTNKQLKTNSYQPLVIVIILLILFIGPLILAWVMVADKDTLGEKTTNNGQLIRPPLQLAKLPLLTNNGKPILRKSIEGRWLMLYVIPGSCDQYCEQRLYYMRQIRTATGRDMTRVERALVTFTTTAPDSGLDQLLVASGTQHFRVERKKYQQFIKPLPLATLAMQQGSLYLVDPKGNVMMFYTDSVKPAGIFKDLTRLLKVSQIG